MSSQREAMKKESRKTQWEYLVKSLSTLETGPGWVSASAQQIPLLGPLALHRKLHHAACSEPELGQKRGRRSLCVSSLSCTHHYTTYFPELGSVNPTHR